MPKGYRQLTRDQRCQISALKQSGSSQASIARHLGLSASTICCELKRNAGRTGFETASRISGRRRSKASSRPSRFTPDLIDQIEEYLTERQWSPEQISGFLKSQGLPFVSHERIYQHIWADKKAGGTLYKSLRHSGKKYCKQKGKTSGRGVIPGRIDIDQRPKIVEEKSRIGDWEGDLIIGANHKGAIMSHVDRKSKYTKLTLLEDKKAETIIEGCRNTLLPLALFIHTITYDNGKEFAGHMIIGDMLGVTCYFATPYHSWERGLNEHTNGLVRQYFPKGTDFAKLTPAEVQAVEDKLNSRPRKILGFKTPREVFAQAA